MEGNRAGALTIALLSIRTVHCMVVGVLRAEFAIYEAHSLKDKRRIVSSLKDRIGPKYRVSIAEVDEQDLRQKAVIGVSLVANERRHVETCLSKIVDEMRRTPGASLLTYDIEYL